MNVYAALQVVVATLVGRPVLTLLASQRTTTQGTTLCEVGLPNQLPRTGYSHGRRLNGRVTLLRAVKTHYNALQPAGSWRLFSHMVTVVTRRRSAARADEPGSVTSVRAQR